MKASQFPAKAPLAPAQSAHAVALVAVALAAACTINPATGNRQFNLIPESQEIALGREADPAIVEQYGLYEDEALQSYVRSLGARLASTSERPHLPWTFRVLDDPVVNAFALPGGFIYITRGILAHLSSEAELVGVMGHEIGHVTARHGVSQMSKGLLAQAGVGITAAAGVPGAGSIASAAQTGLGLVFLKNGRDDERQADRLGVRYAIRNRYDPHPMVHVFETLRRVSELSSQERIPGWLSTHPAPENRQELLRQEIASYGGEVEESFRVGEKDYLDRLDGLVVGEDPRAGFFQEALFVHPAMDFQFQFPNGWKTVNLTSSVTGISAEQNAVVRISRMQEENADTAAEKFFEPEAIHRRESRGPRLRGFENASYRFSIAREEGDDVEGVVTFVELGNGVFSLLGYCLETRFSGYERLLGQAIDSFRRVRDRDLLDVEPLRLRFSRLPRRMSLQEWAEGRTLPLPVERLALMNNVEVDETLPQGTRIKIVVGQLPGA